MKTGFLFFFFVADHLLTSWPVVYKSQERQEPSIMCESDTLFNQRDQRCAAVQVMLSTDPSYDNRTIASTLKMQIWIATNNRDVPRVIKTKVSARVMVFGVVSSEGHIIPPHIFEVGLKVNTKVYLDVLKSVVILLGNQAGAVADLGCGSRTRRRPTRPKRPRLASEGVLRLCTLLSLALLLPWPEPAGLLRLVIRREHHQHDLPQHQPDRRHPPSIRRAPAGACGKSMLPVPDLYQGGDWGWRLLHWIDVSSTT